MTEQFPIALAQSACLWRPARTGTGWFLAMNGLNACFRSNQCYRALRCYHFAVRRAAPTDLFEQVPLPVMSQLR